MPYHWWTLPDPVSIRWLPYSSMLTDYAGDLANSVNDLTQNVRRLRAWAVVVAQMTDAEKLEIAHEFVGMLGIASLTAPYAIKSAFAMAAAYLSHQANQAKDPTTWKDELPNELKYLNHVDPIARRWKRYSRFKTRVEAVGGRRFQAESEDFRNAYNHGFEPRLLVGFTNGIRRVADRTTGAVAYEIGGTPPLDLNRVADLLEAECKLCYLAFTAFQSLIAEQIQAIEAAEATPETQA